MNLVNRVVVILGLLTTMVLSAILFIATGPVLRTLILFLQQVEANLMAMTGPRIFLRWVGGLILIFLVWAICAALLWLEIRRPRVKTIQVQQMNGGSAELAADSIANRLEYHIDQLADVIKVRSTIDSGRKGVKVALAVETSPEIDVPGKTEEIQVLTRDIVENRMGLQLDTVRVVLRHTPYSKSIFRGRKAKEAVQPKGRWLRHSSTLSQPVTVGLALNLPLTLGRTTRLVMTCSAMICLTRISFPLICSVMIDSTMMFSLSGRWAGAAAAAG